ncbi:MAG TPA: RNB domain-containing ribonuclease [Solirubrobacteraceae bacterium]|nr:RNB domain-containing ribonuclease [Solirubrobacteraceae bacterium]
MSQRAAVLERRGRFLVARPLFGRGRDDDGWGSGQLSVDPGKARAGELVLVGVRAGRRGARATVVRRLGRPDVARDVIEALMVERGLRRRFPRAVELEAQEAAAAAEVDVPRRDLRDLDTFTIDPTGARDYDDAISAERLADGSGGGAGPRVRVWVHIADVSSFVAPGSAVDREARRRGTSVYVPGAVEPMLGPELSNEACSLVPGADRRVVTAELEFDGPRVVRASFYQALIRSDERLDYDRVDRIFAGAEPARDPWAAPLEAARSAARELAGARERRGALAIVSGEPEFAFDREGHVIDVQLGEQTESHRLIEHLMIAANEQVARLLEQHKLPALYRVHEQPDPVRVERLVAQLASLEVPTPPTPKTMSPTEAGELVGEISQAVDRYVRATGRGRLALTSLVLRSLKQAYYSPRNLGHAGLRSTAYCHFTSPIRRYPDLVCHRSLLAAIGAGPAPDPTGLTDLAEWCSAREREAMEIERAADDVARCFALAREDRDREWDGEVVGLIGAGAFVAFGGRYEGMLPVRRMREGGWWELSEEGTILSGTRAGARLRLGDRVRVRVESIEAPRGRVDLVLA